MIISLSLYVNTNNCSFSLITLNNYNNIEFKNTQNNLKGKNILIIYLVYFQNNMLFYFISYIYTYNYIRLINLATKKNLNTEIYI